MQINREDLNPCTVQLDIVCDPEQVKEGFHRAYKEAAKSVKIPGFRPGHAPRALVEQQISKTAVAEVAAEIIMTDAYKKAVTELDLKPYSTGAVTLKEIEEVDKKCEFTAKVPLPPVVEIGDYSSIPVEKPSMDVTDQEVEEQFEELRKQHSTREAVSDRGVEDGDVAVVNIKVSGEEGDGRNFMIVVGKTFEGMDEALKGMNVEDMKHLKLTFPELFQEKDWAGKEMDCQLTLRSLSSIKLPDIQEMTEKLKFDDPVELKAKIKELIQARKEQAVEEFVQEQLIEELMRRSSVCVPDTMWETVAKQKIQDVAEQLREQKKTFADFVKEKGMTEDEFIDAQHNEAKTYVMRAQLIQDIFIKEKMVVSNEDLNEELLLMAKEYSMEPRDLLQALQKNDSLREVHYQSIHRKVMDFLMSKAETKEVARV
ncbi:MAG TPA: trigger factor [Fimbriimonadaceae bacterium]